MLEVLRDHDSDAASEFRLLVQKHDGAWDVTLSIAPHDELNITRNRFHVSTTLGTTWRHCGREHYKRAAVALQKHPSHRSDWSRDHFANQLEAFQSDPPKARVLRCGVSSCIVLW